MSNYLMKMIMSSASEAVDPWYIPLTFTAGSAGSTVKLTKNGSPTVDGLQYRIGTSGEWLPYTIDTVITLANVGDIVQFQNTKEALGSYFTNYVKFVLTKKIAASGNVQSMLNYVNYCNTRCFQNMFQNCSSLTQAPELPATTLDQNCYDNMFQNCKSLTQAPELPATTLATNCYNGMFKNCTGLTHAPELPATTLARFCYQSMFENCTGLTQAPELPATTMFEGCYKSMFYNCAALTQAPELPATTLATSCYEAMFQICSNLNYINCNFSDWKPASLSTNNWVVGVSSTGTFISPPNLSLEYGPSRMPEGWEIIGPEGINAEDQTYSFFVGEEINKKLAIYTNPSNHNLEVVEGTIPTGLEITSDGYLRGSVTEEFISHFNVKITIPGTTYEKTITINVEAYASMAYDPIFYFPCINENIVYVKNMNQSFPLYFKQMNTANPVTFSIDDEGIKYAYIATQTVTTSQNRTLQAQNLTYNRFFDNYTGDWSAFYRVKLVESFTSGTRNLICIRASGAGKSLRIGLKVDETAGFMFLYIDNYNGGDDNNGYTFGSRADRAVEVGQWYDIAITYNSTNKEYKFYMNKVHKTTSYESLDLKIYSYYFYIGSYTGESNWNKTVASQLSDITFWDKCLTDEEVQSL